MATTTTERDEPIYVMCHSYNPASMYWYVIEEKDDDNDLKKQRHIHKRKQSCLFVNKKLADEGLIEVLHESESDRIRSLRLPNLSNSHIVCDTEFYVVNSCLYLLGGNDSDKHDNVVYNHHIRFCDLNFLKKGWQISGSFDVPMSFTDSVTSFKNGSIFIEGVFHFFRLKYSLKSNSLDWKLIKIPPPFPEIYNLQFCRRKIIVALTDTDVFWRMYCGNHLYGVRFNLEELKWHGFDKETDKPFDGIFSKGVVLFDCYLFLFGTVDPYKEDAYLQVYDLNTRKWLPDRNEYGNFDKKKVLPLLGGSTETTMPFLLQVRDNKLALVWYEYITKFQEHPRNIIHCTKFVIHKPSSDTNDTLVYPEVVSHGTYRTDGVLLNAAARVTVRADDERNLGKGRLKDQCHKIVEQDSFVGKNEERSGRCFLSRKCKKQKI